jgi:hypothetical protein
MLTFHHGHGPLAESVQSNLHGYLDLTRTHWLLKPGKRGKIHDGRCIKVESCTIVTMYQNNVHIF